MHHLCAIFARMNKTAIKALCVQKLENQIQELKLLIAEVQASSNQETKSTAGDKHDTARAQAQNEVERIGNQLLNLEKMLVELNRISTDQSEFIKLGSFVSTSCGQFYLSVSLGKLNFESTDFFAISNQSPIGQILLTKKKNDSFQLPNGNSCSILEVW